MKINKNSWHYKVATWFDGYNFGINPTICSYIRGFLRSVILAFAFTLIIVMLLGAWILLVAEPVMMTYQWLVNDVPFYPVLGADKESPWLLFGMSMVLHGLIIFGLLSAWISDTFVAADEGSFRAVVKTQYRGWKDKYCPTVEFVDED